MDSVDPALMFCDAPLLRRDEAHSITGTAVVVDVLRAFTTAAYAFAAGASVVYVADAVDEALALKAAMPGALAMGEDGGHWPDGFDFANSPVQVAAADLEGRVMVHRTSAGTRGLVAASNAAPTCSSR